MKEEKFESILDSAKKLFGHYSFKKTSIDEIARKARVAKATIYNYFGSKDYVYMEVLRRETDEIVEKIINSINKESLPPDKLRAFIMAKFRYMSETIDVLNLDRARIDEILPSAQNIRNSFFEREVDIVNGILNEGVENGFFHLNDVFVAAKAICHSLRRFEIDWLVQETEDNIEKYLDELINILFYGILSKRVKAQVNTVK